MRIKGRKLLLTAMGISLILSCNDVRNNPQIDRVDAAHVTDKVRAVTKDSLKAVIIPEGSHGGRQISEADKQYLTLTVPDYSEIVLQHEAGKETLRYTAALQQYFIERNCSINGNEFIKHKSGVSMNKRFYIQHVGDNRYVALIYDQYGNEDHP